VAGGCPAGATCTNVLDADPLLGPLQDNGGFTQTMALGVGSAALDAGGVNVTCAATDQRGITRPQGAACDIGAYEHNPAPMMYAEPGGLTSGWCDSWGAACELRYALPLAVSGQQVWVVAGTYTPTSGTDRTLSFTLKNGVAIYGGFAGTETLITQRNPTLHVTTLSGEIGAAGNSDNSYHVVKANGVSSTAVLDGFTITSGDANGASPDDSGGGMYNIGSSPTLSGLIFNSNSASSYGGGMYNDSGNPVLTNVLFSNNTASAYGGGMYNDGGSPSLTDVTFNGNSATLGGGLYNNSSDPALTDVTFSGNSAIDGGGGMYNNSSSPILTDITFSSNTATGSGGGMYNIGSSPVLSSSPALSNVTFSSNSAANSGGGMYNYDYSSPTLSNVTFSGNSATSFGGGIFNHSSNPTISNSIFWGNGATGELSNGLGTTITDSIVAGGCPAGATCTNVLDADPLLGPLQDNGGFTQTMALGVGSAALDAGGVNVTCAATDQRGVARPQGAACDIGAYEHDFTPVVYVKPGGLTSGWCDSWANGCELSYALPMALSGQQVWVVAGTYTPTSGTDRTLSFTLKNGVAIYGGFAGTETLVTQRNPTLHVTTLSGEIGAAGNSDNSYHVVKANGVSSTAVLDGFTITSGDANGASPDDSGGGMYNSAGSPVLTNLTFAGNGGSYGGAMWNSGNPALTNVTFSSNEANSGSGIYNNGGDPSLTDVTFNGNSAGEGGGMYNDGGSPALTNVTFSGNSASVDGGGLLNADSNAVLTNATFSGNSAVNGGGMYNQSSDPTISNSIFWGEGSGGEFFNDSSAPTITDSTVAGGCPTDANCTNVFNDDPKLGPLQANGGFTQTRALLAGSAAIDMGSDTGCPATDQRGIPRPQGPHCDMGAYEAGVTVKIRSTGAQDGWLLESSEKSNTGRTFNTTETTFKIGDDGARRQYRAVLSFSTGGLPDNAVITSAQLILVRQSVTPTGSNPFTLLDGLMIDLRKGYFGTTNGLQVADFQATGNKTVGAFKPAPKGATYTISLPSTAYAYLNATGLTQLRLRFALDDNNDKKANYMSLYSGNATLANRPQLVIQYYVP
ncbi:MAG TPA: choice-of-anchor Q domain-containing protein, partial [Anaerolineales bacterium]|nr:choice-of-anchor Q domain-containing protein [Anaerolineales bacterium]